MPPNLSLPLVEDSNAYCLSSYGAYKMSENFKLFSFSVIH